MGRLKLLLVEDEPELRALLTEELSEQFDVFSASTVSAGKQLARSQRPDIAILDVRLPDGSGVDLCSALRQDDTTSRTKVIMLTGQSDTETVVQSFDNGADDYICKPFRMAELKARVGAKAQRVIERKGSSLGYGNLTLYPEQLAAMVEGQMLRFSTLEYSLLEFFLENGEKIASRKQILKHVWPNTVVSDRTVDAHIVSLRKKLHEFSHEIVTVYGAGYALQKRVAPTAH